VNAEPDYYAVLGVPRDASAEDIKQAFRRLSAHWHPDHNKRADAAERFDELNKAKELLLDPKRRAAYDRDLAHAEAGGSSGDDESAAYDDEETEVIIEPRTIDFGALEAGGPGATADVTLTWIGPEPGLIVPPRGDWWTRAEIKRPGVEALYVITLLAEAPAGMPTGNHRSHFTVIANGVPQPVELVMKVRGTPSASSPTDRSTYAPGSVTAPATAVAAFMSRWSWVSGRLGWFFASLAALALSFHMPTFVRVLLLLSMPLELYRTFRPRRMSDFASLDRLGLQAALAAALLAVSIVVFSYQGQASSSAASSGNTGQAGGGGSATNSVVPSGTSGITSPVLPTTAAPTVTQTTPTVTQTIPDSGPPYLPTGTFSLENYNSHECLGIAGGADDANAIQWDCNGAPDQTWHIGQEDGASGYYQIVNGDGECLGVYAISTTEGAAVVGWDCLGTTHQDQYWAWAEAPGDPGYYYLMDHNSGEVVGVWDNGTTEGTQIVQWPNQRTPNNQLWQPERT
jgi:hypothetical protein